MRLIYILTIQEFAIFSTFKFSSLRLFFRFCQISLVVVCWLDYRNENVVYKGIIEEYT